MIADKHLTWVQVGRGEEMGFEFTSLDSCLKIYDVRSSTCSLVADRRRGSTQPREEQVSETSQSTSTHYYHYIHSYASAERCIREEDQLETKSRADHQKANIDGPHRIEQNH